MSQTGKQQKKQPKKTDKIRRLLDDYVKIQRRIDNIEERIAFLEYTMDSPSPPNLTGMPGGSRDGTSKQERDYIKCEELKEKLGNLNAEESRRREEIEELLELMEKPDEQTLIEMRYFDRAKWKSISVALYGNEPDYEEHEKRYEKRTYKKHGAALLSLARIYEKHKGQ